MSLPLLPTAAACALFLTIVYKFILHPAFISPLSKVPSAHWSSSISPLWVLYHRLLQQDTPVLACLHKKFNAPILRIAPNELSVNCVSGGLRTIYSGGFEKGTWYSNVFSNYDVQPMFAMEDKEGHSKRKRILSNIYAKSTLQSSKALDEQTEVIIKERLRPRIFAEVEKEATNGGGGIEFYDIFCAVTMDFVSAYIFGLENGSDFLVSDKDGGIRLFHDFKARQKYTFWPQECPGFTRFLAKLGLKWLVVPTWVDGANQDIESWLMGMCEKAKQTVQKIDGGGEVNERDVPTVYRQLEGGLQKEQKKSGIGAEGNLKIEIASELLDHTLAGFDTSSITLTWLAWQLSKTSNQHWQDMLRKEISTLKEEDSLDAKSIDALPILHAILMESLRLHAAIPGQQPRITPSHTLTTLGDPEAGAVYANLPPNTRVQSQAYALHRNPNVFPDPDSWLPDRWLNASSSPSLTAPGDTMKDTVYTPRTADQLREMSRYFWAFGSGGRMCVGSNLAMLDMKATIVGIWGKFQTTIVDDEGMVPNGGYMAEPLGVGKGGHKGIGGKYAGGELRKFLRLKVVENMKA